MIRKAVRGASVDHEAADVSRESSVPKNLDMSESGSLTSFAVPHIVKRYKKPHICSIEVDRLPRQKFSALKKILHTKICFT
jgi:hypothetical protein